MTAFIIHDGKTILEASPAFLELFRCDLIALIDRPVEEIVAGDDFRALARWRGEHIIRNGRYDIEYKQPYAFLRFDGSQFWGEAISRRIDVARYKTVVVWSNDE
jgi:PAS domain S-box-containing protein